MKKNIFRYSFNCVIYSLITTIFVFVIGINVVNAQSKDHLTDQESDLIREAQEIDARMEVFIKAIDRRFMVLEGKQNNSEQLSKKEAKRLEKEKEKWGELPDASQTKLLTDIEKILDEAINNIDDAVSRDSQSELFPKAVHIFAKAANGFLPKLNNFYEQAKNERESAVTYQAIEYCKMIIESSAKVKEPEVNKKKKKKNS